MAVFRRQKKLAGPVEAPLSPAMAALADCNASLVAGRQRVREIETRISRLRQVVADELPAADAVQHAVAEDGGAELQHLAAGRAGGDLAELVSRGEHASRAAAVARAAMPRAERDLIAAVAEVEKLIGQRAQRVAAVLIEEADRVGAEYRRAFRELCRLHDKLSGIARGCSGMVDLIVVHDELEAPRFELPSLPSGGAVYSPYLRQVRDTFAIDAAAAEWGKRVAELSAEPE